MENRDVARLCGALAGPLFVGTFLVEGAVRAGYSPLRHPVSGLALGPDGWVQSINFVVTGALLVTFAVGCRDRVPPAARWLLAAVGLGMVGSGVFVTDPVNGYPPGTPPSVGYTWHGALHDLFAVPTFVGWPIAMIVVAVGSARSGAWRWAVGSALAAVLFLTGFGLTNSGFAQVGGLDAVAGLTQRLTVVVGFAWLAALAISTSSRYRPAVR